VLEGRAADTKFVGTIAFVGKLIGIAAGLAFQVIVTRRLEPPSFGLYHLVLSVVTYFAVPVAAISYWSARDCARGSKAVPTALISGIGLSFASVVAYVAFSFLLSGWVDLQFIPFVVGAIVLILTCEGTIVHAIAATVKPHVVGYLEIVRESVKVLAGFVFVHLFRLELIGALLSWVTSLLSAAGLGLALLGERAGGKFDWTAVKRWMRGWWLPIFGNGAALLVTLDVLVVAALSSMISVSYLSAATVISSVVLYTIALTSALYPQLLAGGSEENIDEAFRFWLLFSVPMTLGLSSLAPAIAHVLRQEYAVAYLAIAFRVVGAFFITFGDILIYITAGHEKLLADDVPEGKPISSSSTFRVITVRLVTNLVYIGSIFMLIHFLTMSDLDVAIAVAFLYLLLSIISLVPKYLIARSLARFHLPVLPLVRYVACFVPSLVFLWLFYPFGAFSERISDVLLNLVPPIAGAATLYFISAFLVDPYFRGVVSSVVTWVVGEPRTTHSSEE